MKCKECGTENNDINYACWKCKARIEYKGEV